MVFTLFAFFFGFYFSIFSAITKFIFQTFYKRFTELLQYFATCVFKVRMKDVKIEDCEVGFSHLFLAF